MRFVWAALLAGAFLFCYAGVFRDLTRVWWASNFYSYGFLVPLISGYLVWSRRELLRRTVVRSSPAAGSALLIGGLALLIAGHAAGVSLAEDVSIVVVVAGTTLLVLGPAQLKALLFPIGYLAFMIPAWDFFTTRLHPPLQMFAARVGIALIRMLGIPVAREGTMIYLPHRALHVAEACSGVNFLIAVIAVGIPLAYLTLRGWTRRILLVVFGVLVALLSNSVRVALIGVLSYLGVAGDVHGPGHVLQGMFVAVIGYIALFAGAWLLSRGEARPPAAREEAHPALRPDPGPGGRNLGPAAIPLGMACAALLAGGWYVNLYHPAPVPLANNLSDFPRSFGPWTGQDTTSDDSLFTMFDPDSSLLRTYRRGQDEPVLVYLAYDASQRRGRDVIDERTRILHESSSVLRIPLVSGGTLPANRVLRRLGTTNRLVLFWYDINGHVTNDRLAAKLHAGWNLLRWGKATGGLIMVATDFGNDTDPSPALARVEEFARAVLPLARDYLTTGSRR